MTDNTQPEALDLADWLEAVGGGPSAKRCAALLREQHARIVELEAQLEAIGAGGVSGPLMARASLAASELPEGVSRDDTVHGETYFTAADMATASAQGFRDGVASLAASAGSEPVAHSELFEYLRTELSAIPCRYRGDPGYDHDAYWMRDKVEKLLDEAERIFAHPSPPEGMVAVPKEFILAFSDTAHNYQLSVEPPDHFSGTEGDAFRAAYARCGVELLRLRGILIGHLPASEAKEL